MPFVTGSRPAMGQPMNGRHVTLPGWRGSRSRRQRRHRADPRFLRKLSFFLCVSVWFIICITNNVTLYTSGDTQLLILDFWREWNQFFFLGANRISFFIYFWGNKTSFTYFWLRVTVFVPLARIEPMFTNLARNKPSFFFSNFGANWNCIRSFGANRTGFFFCTLCVFVFCIPKRT